MSIFDTIAAAFAPKSKAPNPDVLERLEREAATALEAACGKVDALKASRPDILLQGEAGRLAFRDDLRRAEEDRDDCEAALAAIRDRLAAARLEEAEKARRAAYSKADAAQRTAQTELLARYPAAVAELVRLRELVAEADRLAEAVNADLPQGASRLLETESVRDVPASPDRILREELADAWFTTEGNTPVDPDRVARQQGRRGVIYADSAFGPRPIPCELRRVRKVTRQPWAPPAYAARIGDLVLPELKAEPVTTPKPVTELVLVPEVAEAAE
ncbi:hypothetical protein [Xanthobacter autotrophicus]|uniref:hypothetical protein n=1 Tax=Xanthobacter autotrophicus TaxID=280 RepID=UPI00372C80EE